MTRTLCISLIAAMSAMVQAADWKPLPRLPAPNGGAACGVAGGKILFVGGTNWEGGVKSWLATVHEYDPVVQKWSTQAPLEAPVAYAVGGLAGNEFVFGGGSTGKEVSGGILRFSEGKRMITEWKTKPAHVVLSAGGVIGDELFFVGGTDDAANVAALTKATISVNWKTGVTASWPDYPGKAVGIAGSVVVSDELFVFAGANWDAGKQAVVNSREAHAFSVTKKSWRALKSFPLPVRGLSAVVLDEHRIYLGGGFRSDTEAFSAAAWIYEVKTDTYREAKPFPLAAMMSLVRLGDEVFAIGGEDKMKARTDKVFSTHIAELEAK